MRRGSIGERPEPTQQLALLGAEAGDIDDAFRSRQHRQKTEQQHLVKRVDHLATLSRVRKGSKMIKKKQSPRPEPLPCPSCRPFAASEAADRFRTLPRCHALFHPIALGEGPGQSGEAYKVLSQDRRLAVDYVCPSICTF